MVSQNLAYFIERLRSQTRDFYNQYSTILMLSLVYGTTKLLGGLFILMTFTGYGPTSGYFLEQGQFTFGGAYPFIDYWVEYPPMFPWINIASYRLSTLIPGDQALWFGTFRRWTLLPFDIGGVILIYLIARKLGTSEDNALRASLLYVAAFVTMYVPLGWFDALPLFWLLLTTYFAITNRPVWSGLAAGVGFLAKPISVLALPMAWQRLTSKDARFKLTLAALAAVLIPALPFVLSNPDMSLAFIRNMMSRSSWETVWALIDGYHSYGSVAPLEKRFDPSSATWTVHSGDGDYGPWAIVGFGILYIFLWTRRIDWLENRRAIAFVGLTWCLFCLWSRGYSPQWAINFIPFVVLLMPNLRGAVYLMLLGVGLVAEWPGAFVLAWGQQWYFDAIIIWRTVLTLLLALEFGTLTLVEVQSTHKLRLVYSVLVGVLIMSGLAIGARAAHKYFDLQLTTEPLRSTINLLQSETTSESGLVCREIEVCERISPYVPQLDMHWLPSPSSWQAETLSEFANQHPVLWLVEEFDEESGHDLSVESWLSGRYGKVSQVWIDGARVVRFVSIDLPDTEPVKVLFGDQIRLSGYAFNLEGQYLNLLLLWENTETIDIPYKLFIHVTDSNGEIVAQNDQFPVGNFLPPNEWQPGSTVRDMHGLILPQDTSEQYHIRIGWYQPDTGERLTIQAPPRLQGEQIFEIQIEGLSR